MATYYIDFPTTSTTELDEWPYYSQGSRAYWGIVVPRLRIILSRYDTQYMQALAPRRSVADGSLVTWDIPITGEDYNADIYQYYPYSGARVDFYIQIGNTRFGLAVWIYEHYGESDETRICKLTGTVTDYHFQRTLVNMTGAMKITYNAATGVAEAYVDGSLVHTATYGTGLDCLFGIHARGKLDYGMMCYIPNMTITAGTLSEILYTGDVAGSLEPLEFVSPYDGFLGNGAFYDLSYDTELQYLFPEPASWSLVSTFTDTTWTGNQCSINQINSVGGIPAGQDMDIQGHFSGFFRWYMAKYNNYVYNWSIWIDALDKVTGEVHVWRCRHYRTLDPQKYHIEIIEPDGTPHTYSHDWTMVRDSWTECQIEFNEVTQEITWSIMSNEFTRTIVSPNWVAEHYRIRSVQMDSVDQGYCRMGCYSWWFRGVPASNDPLMDSAMFMIGLDSAMECTGTQWTEKVFNVFRNAIYNPLVPDDPSTVKGMKLTNVDGLGTDMALDSVCVVIDMYKRIYVYMLKQDMGVPEALPHQIPSVRSPTGHYWDLIDIKTANDEDRIYSEQCTVEVSLATPGVCEFDPAADNSKTMIQLVHQGVVNPLYLRAFKVPGQNKISVVASEEISAYEVIVNFLLAT